MNYFKETTYLVKINNELGRWHGDNTLVYFGSKEDALSGFSSESIKTDNIIAIPVSDCSDEIQREYEQQIDKDYKEQ